MWSQSRERSSGSMITVDMVCAVMKAVIWLFIKDIHGNSKPLLNELFKKSNSGAKTEQERKRGERNKIDISIHKCDLKDQYYLFIIVLLVNNTILGYLFYEHGGLSRAQHPSLHDNILAALV